MIEPEELRERSGRMGRLGGPRCVQTQRATLRMWVLVVGGLGAGWRGRWGRWRPSVRCWPASRCASSTYGPRVSRFRGFGWAQCAHPAPIGVPRQCAARVGGSKRPGRGLACRQSTWGPAACVVSIPSCTRESKVQGRMSLYSDEQSGRVTPPLVESGHSTTRGVTLHHSWSYPPPLVE